MSNQRSVQYCNNQYDRIRVLGKGSFGTAIVYRRRADCTLVVLKEIDLSRFHNEHERSCALQEAQIMSKLNHNNIIKYYNAYTTETKLIIEMEYASIGTLQAYLSFQSQPLEEQEILIIFRQIVSGLSYLHSKNIIHLDLKMANIFVTIEGIVKIGDFGIAQFLQSSSGSHELNVISENKPTSAKQRQSNNNNNSHQLGTLAYSSPERCLGEPTDFKSDIWSLGCILYELVTLKPLFASGSLPELVLSITRIQYQPIKRNITPALRDIFEQMVARDPVDRPPASELVCLTDQLLSRIQNHKQRALLCKQKRSYHHNRFVDLSSEAAFSIAPPNNYRGDMNRSINYPHSLVYQVRLDARNIHVDRVNLPQTKRVKEMSKGKSHYLVLTYDNIVYGWGSKNCGQLGACNLTSSLAGGGSGTKSLRATRSARNSMNFKDLQLAQTLEAAAPSQLSSTPSSLASSTQTIVTSHPVSALAPQQSSSSTKTPVMNQHLSKQLIMSMLENSQPATRPFIINELNNRKIIQIGAGNDFSVFLSKTGIVMTCGDGSTGCLGRGDLKSCFTPCMVDSLLNRDVVGISCGPKHVIAVCGNGRAFAWGKFTRGRLGVLLEDLFDDDNNNNNINLNINNRNRNLKNNSQSASKIIFGKYVVRPQPVHFPPDVFIKSVYCADRGTIFIDSNDRCWACGENRFNKLGLDIKRRFKRTIIVGESWLPTEIVPLNKYKIVSCNIGKNHSGFMTNEGKLIVFGQDIDHSHRLKSNIVGNRESHRRISSELQTTRRRAMSRSRRNQDNEINCHKMVDNDSKKHGQLNYKQLAQAMLLNNQLFGFKHSYEENLDGRFSQNINKLPKYKVNRFQRQQIDSYLRKSRATRKMPFECVVSVSCTSKFTLALTNDNRVYFWGTRSYDKGDPCLYSILSDGCKTPSRDKCVEPQLVASCSDECFIKIGSTNSSLMTSIQLLGSDQPIIHAQDPRLTASSLADLWILDYKPSGSTSSSSDSLESISTCSCLCASNRSNCSECCSNENIQQENETDVHDDLDEDYFKHDAILQPQPIVSLYVPSMFNQNGCTLHLVNLFCFDEDRFYLILDTTIKLQSHTSRITRGSPRMSKQFSIGPQHQQQQNQRLQSQSKHKLIAFPESNNDPNHLKLSATVGNCDLPLSAGENGAIQVVTKINEEAPFLNSQSDTNPHQALSQTRHEDILSQNTAATPKIELHECCCDVPEKKDVEPMQQNGTNDNGNNLGKSICNVNDNSNENCSSNTTLVNSSSQGGNSLEEPRSFSTFGNTIGNHIIVGPTMSSLDHDQSLQPLRFNQPFQGNNFDERTSPSGCLSQQPIIPYNEALVGSHLHAPTLRRFSRQTNRSESTTFTGDDVDDTSSMPSWVKNEYIQHQHSGRAQMSQLFSIDSSANEETCLSEITDVTLATNETNNLKGGDAVYDVSKENTSTNCPELLPSVDGIDNNVPIPSDDGDNELDPHLFLCNDDDRGSILVNTTKSNEHINFDYQRAQFSKGALREYGSIGIGREKIPRDSPFHLNAISRSQPDVSDNSKLMSIERVRRASTVSDDVANLLNCNVYKSTNYRRRMNHYPKNYALYQSSNLNSEMSSRSGSIHPLIKPMSESHLEPLVAHKRDCPTSEVMQTLHSSYKSANYANDQLHLSNCSINPSELDNLSNSIHEVIAKGEPNDDTQKFGQTNGRATLLSRSVQLHEKQQKVRAASCSSINSLRRSFAKLFC